MYLPIQTNHIFHDRREKNQENNYKKEFRQRM